MSKTDSVEGIFCSLVKEKVCLRFKVCHRLFDRKSSQFSQGMVGWGGKGAGLGSGGV